jgi:hypothetical protein
VDERVVERLGGKSATGSGPNPVGLAYELGVSGRFIPLPQQFYIDLKKYTKTESNRAFDAGNLLFRKTDE